MMQYLLKHKNLKTLSLALVVLVTLKVTAQEPAVPIVKDKDSVVKPRITTNKTKKLKFNGNDGPYIINDTLYRVNANNRFTKTTVFNRDSILVKVDNKAADSFYVALNTNYKIPETVYSMPEKMVVISDIEGNFNAFSSFLLANKVIDNHYNWIYGKGHLVLLGDFVDRGKNVTQVLWLIYKLEQQAKAQNGQVHFILGNHEALNFYGDYRYNKEKYIKVAQNISQLNTKKEALKYLYAKHSVIGKWLASKNVVEKIGDYLFVHGGISTKTLDYKLTLAQINTLSRTRYTLEKATKNKVVDFFYSANGPLWYRGLVKTTKKYPKINANSLEAILNYYNVKKIVVGHTLVKTVSSDFNGKVIRIDVRHGDLKFSSKTKGLLIENNQEFIISANRKKTGLKPLTIRH